jgi:hypothetical protein
MALETGTYVSDLNINNPTITDQIDQGDDHIRLIKKTLKNTFPNVSGAVTLTQTEINALPADIAAVETTINTTITDGLSLKAPLNAPTFTGIASADTPAAGTSTTQLATTAFVATELDNYVAAAANIGADSVALGTKTTGNYAAAVHGDTNNSSGVASIAVSGSAGEGTDFGLELSYQLTSEGSVSDPPTVANFNGKKFLFLY